MIVSKSVVAANITSGFKKIMFNKEKTEELLQIAEEKFSVPTGVVMDYMTKRLNVFDANLFVQFILCYCIDKVNGSDFTRKCFSDGEIQELSKMKMESNKIKFPIRIECIQINSAQWIGRCDVSFLMKLRESQLINYNKNAQRTMKRIVRDGNYFYKISINETAVKQISEAFLSGVYIPNTITLNIPEEEFEFDYDEKANELVIKSLDHFDISDGYHRYLAMSRIWDADKGFNYPMELRITHFSDDHMKQFIFQEDQKTQMRKVDSDSMNMNDPCNIVTEMLNADTMCTLGGRIRRSGGDIGFSEFAQLVKYFYYRNSTIKSEPKRFIFETKKNLKTKFDALMNSNEELLSKTISYEELTLMFYCFDKYDNEEEAVERINIGLKNIDKIRMIKGSVIRKGMLKQFEEIA